MFGPHHNPHRILLWPTQALARSSMSLPIEVLEVIVDQASDNTVSLRHLSLKCIALLPRPRYHLFNVLVIRTVQRLEASRDFLAECPWLAPLVRKVTLFVTIPQENSTPNVRILDVVPIHLLARLPNLGTWTMETEARELASISPSLSLHCVALQSYRKHGERIQSLELSAIIFYSKSDFRGLVSALMCLDGLTCLDIRLQNRYPENTTSPSTNPLRGTISRSTNLGPRTARSTCETTGSGLPMQPSSHEKTSRRDKGYPRSLYAPRTSGKSLQHSRKGIVTNTPTPPSGYTHSRGGFKNHGSRPLE